MIGNFDQERMNAEGACAIRILIDYIICPVTNYTGGYVRFSDTTLGVYFFFFAII